jgi:hypothetical protein
MGEFDCDSCGRYVRYFDLASRDRDAAVARAEKAEAEVARLRAFIERTRLACGLVLLPDGDAPRSTSAPTAAGGKGTP